MLFNRQVLGEIREAAQKALDGIKKSGKTQVYVPTPQEKLELKKKIFAAMEQVLSRAKEKSPKLILLAPHFVGLDIGFGKWLLTACVPALTAILLLPLVENAARHGIEQQSELFGIAVLIRLTFGGWKDPSNSDLGLNCCYPSLVQKSENRSQ